ncbi:unnamed protein product, partial [Rotaria sp. Silwood2]
SDDLLAGQRIEIYTNHFKINFCTPPNKIILYQFDLGVEVLMSDGSWQRWTGRGATPPRPVPQAGRWRGAVTFRRVPPPPTTPLFSAQPAL